MNEPYAPIKLLVYPGPPDRLLDRFTTDLWEGRASQGVQQFLSSGPSFEQILAAIVAKREFWPVRVHCHEYFIKIRSLKDTEIFETLNPGLRLEALALCLHPDWLRPSIDIISTWDVYAQFNAVRALARVRRTAEAAAVLDNLRGLLDNRSRYCLVSDICFAGNEFDKVVHELGPEIEHLPIRYLRLLARSYAQNSKTYNKAIEVFELLPSYDFYRWHDVPRLKAGKSIDQVHWDLSMSRQLSSILYYINAVKPLDELFARRVRSVTKA